MVAAARKLVVIAWHMLRAQEPYRYAQPRSTQEKLARLRIKATGKRKRTGPKHTGKPSPNQGTGVRTRAIPALKRVCAEAGLPAPRSWEELPPGEQRALQEAGVAAFVTAIGSERRQPRWRDPEPEAELTEA